MFFLGIDQSTTATGLCLIEMVIDDCGFDEVKIIKKDCLDFSKNKSIQKRLYMLKEKLNEWMKDISSEYKEVKAVREEHDPRANKCQQVAMSTGVVDAVVFGYGYELGKNYFSIPPINWRIACFGSDMSNVKKTTKGEKIAYCSFFEKTFNMGDGFLEGSSDVADAFGLAYCLGCTYYISESSVFKDGMDPYKRERLVKVGFDF